MRKCICRVCGTIVLEFLDLGFHPIANRFLKPTDSFADEYFYHLIVCFCPNCELVQLANVPESNRIFNDDYPFFTSSSNYMKKHFEKLADYIKTALRYDFIVEIGSNDGTFLEHFKNQRHLGIEPSGSVLKESIDKGINTLNQFFTETVADIIINEPNCGRADVIVSTNVFPHVPERGSFLRGIKKLLSKDGVWINEEVYLGDIIGNLSYDQFYNEHVFYASLSSYTKLFDTFDLKIVDYEFINAHGGSVRFYIKHKHAQVSSICGLTRTDNFTFDVLKEFGRKIKNSKWKLVTTLRELQNKKEEVVGYGATAKSSTILNYCGIDKSLISKIYDTTPLKQNTLSPGMHIPIVSYDTFHKDNPKNVVLFAWNHAKEIYEKESYKNKDINWIIPI